ncbi:uncharacterized protein LOC134826751 [Bolinopsis microptera]|uniref:uncharacterized protein LOC134826751 n=1 Tax=Bolinopsis microptera TaxID=2820187 RepID=UPI00307A0E33
MSQRMRMFAGLTVTRQLKPLGERKQWSEKFRGRNPSLVNDKEIREAVGRFCHIEGSAVTEDTVREVGLRYKKMRADRKHRLGNAKRTGGITADVAVQTESLHSLECKECTTNAMKHICQIRARELAQLQTEVLLRECPSPQMPATSSPQTPQPQQRPSAERSRNMSGSSTNSRTCAVLPRSRVMSNASSISDYGPESIIDARVRLERERRQRSLVKIVTAGELFKSLRR